MPFIYGQYDTGRQLEAPGQMAGYRTAAQVFGENVESGIGGNTIGLIHGALENAATMNEGEPLTEQQWNDGPYKRPGIKFQAGWTTARAALEAERYDNQHAEAYHSAQHPIAAIGGSITGSMLDPAMLAPFGEPVDAALEAFKGVKVADTIAKALEMSRAARFVNGAVAGGGAEGMFQAANMAYQASEGQTPDWKSALLHTGAIAALGGLGAQLGGFVRKAHIVNKAIDDMEHERPVSVDDVPEGHGDFPASQPNLGARPMTAPKWKKTTVDGESQYTDESGNIAPESAAKTFDAIDEQVTEHQRGLRLGASCLGL